jgi:glycogen debranching enzyme
VTGTIADLFPLYAGAPDGARARRLVDEHLLAPDRFGPSPWAVTTVSRASPDFDPRNYWRGPVWINVNWFMIRGLERYGFESEADHLRRLTLDLVSRSGFTEYYEPTTGEPLGSREFSWSASLTLDLLRDRR